MKFVYSRHFQERNKLRNIHEDVAEKIFNEADGHYRDTEKNTLTAVKRFDFQGKERDVSLTYLEMGDEIIFITIHPLKEGQKRNRIESGRWMPL